jgi:hypothetical protein
MTKDELKAWLISKSYKEDIYGHFQKEKDGKTYRYKIQDISIRYETKIKYSDGQNGWIRIMSGYFKALSLNDKGQLCGFNPRPRTDSDIDR